MKRVTSGLDLLNAESRIPMTNSRPIRILLAKIGLDGHDRGVKVLARSFREAGFEVIYTGLWQTCEATVHAAMQEDVDVIGVSLLSAAHMTVIPEIMRYRRELGIESIPVLLGGIVPESDHPRMREMGVSAVFNPGSSTETIVQSVRTLAAQREVPRVDRLAEAYRKADATALAKLITCVQSGQSIDGLTGDVRRARVFGVTGAPGVGKSSFIGKLSMAMRARNVKVAVVAVDPTSPITGGALLGDRLRMMSSRPEPGFFMRSVASSNLAGGLAPHCKDIVRLFDGFGFDVIFVETVGAGQGDVAVREVVNHVLMVTMPESGDAIQYSKAGIMEIATHFVLNKCDLPGADATKAQMMGALGDHRPIWMVSTLKNEGIDPIADWIASSPTGRN